MKRPSPLLNGAAILIGALVLLICIGGIIGTWVVNRAASNAVLGLLGGLDKATQASRSSISYMNSQLNDMQSLTTSVQQAVAQVGQNVSDQGVILTLLPANKEQELTDTAQRIQQTLINVRDFVTGVRDMYRAIDRLPFVNLPKLDTSRMQEAGDRMDKLTSAVKDLNTRIGEVRSGVAGAIKQASDTVAAINGLLGDTGTQITQVDTQLARLQSGITDAKTIIPSLFVILSVVITLFLLWVAYSQVVVMRQSYNALTQPIAPITTYASRLPGEPALLAVSPDEPALEPPADQGPDEEPDQKAQ